MAGWEPANDVDHQSEVHAFMKIALVILGIYLWEFLNTLMRDYQLVTRRRKFKPAQIIYVVCRYSTLIFLIAINVAMNTADKIPCRAIYLVVEAFMGVALGTSSLLFTLRTLAIWNFDKRVMYPLIVLSLGHWAIILRDVAVTHAIWLPNLRTCAVDAVFTWWLAAMFLYTMVMDILSLIIAILGFHTRFQFRLPTPWCTTTVNVGGPLSRALRKEGMIYFVIATLANVVPVITLLMDLSLPLQFAFTTPAICTNAIAATRTLRRLGDVCTPELYIPDIVQCEHEHECGDHGEHGECEHGCEKGSMPFRVRHSEGEGGIVLSRVRPPGG